jgi:predicted transcriptional regulator
MQAKTGTRTDTDALDVAILSAIKTQGGASVQHIAKDVGKAYNTVLIRCLKMQAIGLLQSSWYGNVRSFYAVEKK